MTFGFIDNDKIDPNIIKHSHKSIGKNMQKVNTPKAKTSKLLTTPLLLAVSSLLLGASLSACQSTIPNDHKAHMSVMTQPAVNVLTAPVADTGLSVTADSSFPIIELMPYLVGQAEALALTPAQIQVFADYRKKVMQNRLALQGNEKALRGQLRQALIAGADEATTTALMHRISETEMAHMALRRDCMSVVRSTLTSAQFDKIIQMYMKTLNL